MSFNPMQGIPTQKIAASASPTKILLPTNSPDMFVALDGAAPVFVRWGDDNLTADMADVPIFPGAFGTFSRGNATCIYVKGVGDLYITHGKES